MWCPKKRTSKNSKNQPSSRQVDRHPSHVTPLTRPTRQGNQARKGDRPVGIPVGGARQVPHLPVISHSTPSPDIPIKQEKHASGNATQSSTSTLSARPDAITHLNLAHTESDTQAQADGEKLMIRVAHPPSNQEAKFMTKSSTSVGKVLSGACKSFGLDADLYVVCLLSCRLRPPDPRQGDVVLDREDGGRRRQHGGSKISVRQHGFYFQGRCRTRGRVEVPADHGGRNLKPHNLFPFPARASMALLVGCIRHLVPIVGVNCLVDYRTRVT